MTRNLRAMLWLLVCLAFPPLPVWSSEALLKPNEAPEEHDAEDHHGEDEDEEEYTEDGKEGNSDDEEDESPVRQEQLYFYAHLEDSPIKEFILSPDEDVWAHHEFLLKPDPNVHRVVEFYANWCPHCNIMRPQVIKFARRIKDAAKNVQVYAVSCVPFRPVCLHFDVSVYPKILLFRAGEAEPSVIEHHELHPMIVLRRIGVELDVALEEDMEDAIIAVPEYEASGAGLNQDHFLPRRKKDIYNDAYLSFHFAMKNGIFANQGPLSTTSRGHFLDFLDLVQATIPPSFKLQPLVSEILSHSDEALASEKDFLALVDKYPPQKKSWSYSCTRGDPSMGYTCGLWELFHIMSVGLVEYNNMVTAVDDYPFYRSMDSAVVLRNFIELFFGCDVCRVHFLQGFDNCAYDGCKRLTDQVGGLSDWVQLPMWLYEFHNGVNLRLLKERAEREGRILTPDDEIAVQWPSRKDCPMCWHDDGKFDPTNVFIFLRLTYWPDDAYSDRMRQNLMGSELNLRHQRQFRHRDAMAIGILLFVITASAIFWFEKRRRRMSLAHIKKNP